MSYLVFPNAIERPNHEGLGFRVYVTFKFMLTLPPHRPLINAYPCYELI
jgi:hypothetical protein